MAETAAVEITRPQTDADKAAKVAAEPVSDTAVEKAPDEPSTSVPSEAAQQTGPQIEFRIQYGKNSADLKRPASSTVAELKAEIEKTLNIPPNMQKLMYKGLLKNDTDTLEKVGIKNGAKVMLIGSSQADIAVAKPQSAAVGGSSLVWDAPKQEENICKQPQHEKVLSKGVPEDAMPGIKDKQVPLPDTLNNFNGLYNSQGSKVRLTFKPELQQLWVASTTSTQKIPYSSISKIESWPVEGKEEYSIIALGLGAGTTSKYWLYYFPSQYVSGIKIRLIGLHALL